MDRRGSPLDINEAQFRELFAEYSADVGNFVGSDKSVEFVIAKSWEEWVNQNVGQLEPDYPDITKPLLPLVKTAAMGQLSVQSLESHLNEDPAEVLSFIQGHLRSDMSLIFDMNGVSFGQKVVLDLNSFNRQVYSVLYLDYVTNGGHVNNDRIRKARQYGNGFAKYLVAHELVHGHVSEIGAMKNPVAKASRQFVSDANYVVTVIDESLAEFVAEQVLRGDGDYGFFIPIHESLNQTKPADTALGFEVSARKAGLPLIRMLYNRFGKNMLDMLKQRLPQSPEELQKPELYIKNSGF